MKQRPATRRGIRVATVYRDRLTEFSPCDMSLLRWLKISEALARHGYEVDMMAGDASLSGLNSTLPNLRFCSLSNADWPRYHVVKTLFHQGFETLCNAGGGDHSFIISKLGSVV